MERVQETLEGFLPELRDLEKKKIFTKPELQEIVKRRTAFETALVRKGSNEKDWLSYIEYEKRLEQLRKLRASKLKLKGRPTISDFSISRHIVSLYASAVTRLPGSTEVWRSYITHVMRVSNSTPEISRVLARAISLHPTNSTIWLLAIRFEADGTARHAESGEAGIGGGNIDAARKLAMRALRFMKGAKDADAQRIWEEWIRLEISFVERMRKRWEILGIQDAMNGKANIALDAANTGDDGLQEGENKMAVDPVADGEDKALEAAQEDVEVAQQKGKNAVLDGAIVKAVLSNACAAFPEDTSMHRSLLATIRPLPTPLRPELLSTIHSSLSMHVLDSPNASARLQARIILAQSHLDDLAKASADGLSLKDVAADTVEWIDAVGACVETFKTGMDAEDQAGSDYITTLPLREAFAETLADCWRKTDDASLRQFLELHILKLVRKDQRKGQYSENIANCARACQEDMI